MLDKFCQQCKELGYENNASFEAIKLDKMKMPYGQFFIGVDDDKIFTFAGVHHFPEVHNNAWRCLFRGAQLKGYTPQWSSDIFKSGIHFSYLLYYQIKFIQAIDPAAEFFISTNVNNLKAGASSRLNKNMMPRVAERGYWTLFKENANIFNTYQNLWKVNTEKYLEDRKKFIEAQNDEL